VKISTPGGIWEEGTTKVATCHFIIIIREVFYKYDYNVKVTPPVP